MTNLSQTDLQAILSRLQADLQIVLSQLESNPANPQGDAGANPAPVQTTPAPSTAPVSAPANPVPTGAPANAAQTSDPFNGGPDNNIIKGKDTNDTIFGNDGSDRLFGNAGDDQLFGGNHPDNLRGGSGNDGLSGDEGDDVLVGEAGTDQLIGGTGRDLFAYIGDVFADGVPAPAGQTGINVLNKPDVISDFTIGEDKFALSEFDLNLTELKFQQGNSASIAGDSNVIALTDPFPAAGAAAKAIANNPNITADEGVFAYFNSTLGLTRLAYSQDLSDGGDVSVLANLDNQRGEAGLANLGKFSAADFTLL